MKNKVGKTVAFKPWSEVSWGLEMQVGGKVEMQVRGKVGMQVWNEVDQIFDQTRDRAVWFAIITELQGLTKN